MNPRYLAHCPLVPVEHLLLFGLALKPAEARLRSLRLHSLVPPPDCFSRVSVRAVLEASHQFMTHLHCPLYPVRLEDCLDSVSGFVALCLT